VRVGRALLGLQQSVNHQQHAHQPVEGQAGGSPVQIADRLVRSAWACFCCLGAFAVDPPSSPPGLTPPVPLPGVVADDLNHLDGTEGGPQSAEGRELVIVGLRHTTIMPPPWPEHRRRRLGRRDQTASTSEHVTTPGRPSSPGVVTRTRPGELSGPVSGAGGHPGMRRRGRTRPPTYQGTPTTQSALRAHKQTPRPRGDTAQPGRGVCAMALRCYCAETERTPRSGQA
jgi:hypothetical protein